MSAELFPMAEMPFNLVAQTTAAPVKILSPREEEAVRAATVRAGGYINTPSMFDGLSTIDTTQKTNQTKPQKTTK